MTRSYNKVKEKIFEVMGRLVALSWGTIKRMTHLGLIIGTIGIWYSVFTNGLGITLAWLIIISSVVAIVIKVREGMRL
jgi:hypothetical protein